MYERGDQTQHGKPHRWRMFQGQLATRESQAGPFGVAERSVLPMKPGNAGGGKGPQLEVNATSDEGRENGDEPNNSRKYSEVADGTKMLMRSGGAGAIGGVTVTAASGIEIALWDLAGRILETPVCNLLGGRFRDRVRFYHTLQAPANPKELSSWRAQAAEAKANNPYGFTGFKFQGNSIPVSADPTYSEPGHDPYARNLTNRDITRIVSKMEAVRDEFGPDMDFAIECHWKYDTQDAIELLNALVLQL